MRRKRIRWQAAETVAAAMRFKSVDALQVHLKSLNKEDSADAQKQAVILKALSDAEHDLVVKFTHPRSAKKLWARAKLAVR